ncbi:hypothetical protein I656_00810 [Geobacillus sp. WSUCF1]|nr:hypothetical protein I656_00810 [Geobacillus sp. WSUCF1]
MATKAGGPLATESGGSPGLSFMYGFGASGSSLKSVFLCLQTERRALFRSSNFTNPAAVLYNKRIEARDGGVRRERKEKGDGRSAFAAAWAARVSDDGAPFGCRAREIGQSARTSHG